MVKLGIFVFANDSGLGAQTRRLAQMLKPHSILAIDSTSFSKNKKQNWHWYDSFKGYKVKGFPNDNEINIFLNDVTHILVCENPLNFHLFAEAKRRGIKTYCQSNYEFCDNLNNPYLPKPDLFLMPSYWKVDEMKRIFGNDKVIYLPPPINPQEFSDVRDKNLAKTGKVDFLHIVGTLAVHDRNGTLDLLKALAYTKGDFRLTIKSQHDLPPEYYTRDSRVIYKIGNDESTANLYSDFDALVLPRRYGGLSLTTNEALICGLPVLMPDISPNNELLPKEWLYPAHKITEFKARVMIDVYESNPIELAHKLDWYCDQNRDIIKLDAFNLGHDNFSESVLREKYENLWSQ